MKSHDIANYDPAKAPSVEEIKAGPIKIKEESFFAIFMKYFMVGFGVGLAWRALRRRPRMEEFDHDV